MSDSSFFSDVGSYQPSYVTKNPATLPVPLTGPAYAGGAPSQPTPGPAAGSPKSGGSGAAIGGLLSAGLSAYTGGLGGGLLGGGGGGGGPSSSSTSGAEGGQNKGSATAGQVLSDINRGKFGLFQIVSGGGSATNSGSAGGAGGSTAAGSAAPFDWKKWAVIGGIGLAALLIWKLLAK